MDPFSALAIAAAVVQFAEIGGKLTVRSWTKYREWRHKRESGTDTPSAEDIELEASLNDLSLFNRTVRQSTDRVVAHDSPGPAEMQLLQLCEECDSIAIDLMDVLGKIKNRPMKKNTQSHLDFKDRKGTHEEDKDRAVLAGLWTPSRIEKMRQRLSGLRQRTTTIILLCLWEDSKQTKKCEVDFSRKLNEILSVLQRVEASAHSTSVGVTTYDLGWLSNQISRNEVKYGAHELKDTPGNEISRERLENIENVDPALRGHTEDSQVETLHGPTTGLVNVLSRVAPSDNMKIREGFRTTIGAESPVVNQIYHGLTERFWQKDWKPQDSASTTDAGQILSTEVLPDLIKHVTDTLRFDTFNGRQDSISQNFESTYQWIFDRQPKSTTEGPLWHSFPGWLEDTNNLIYWVTGKPGSGKSTIMKYIADSDTTKSHLQKWSSPLPVIVVSYYAWIAGHSLQKSWDGLRRTILYQALDKHPKILPLISPRRWALATALPYSTRFPVWDSWEIEESFNLLLQSCGQVVNIALFIDGLDEFDLAPSEVVRTIKQITPISTSLKVCVASRPWTEFDDAFNNLPMLQMHLLTLDDVRLFVAGQLNENQGFKEILDIYPSQADRIKSQIVAKSRGVFLWVSVVVKSLLESLSEGESIAALQETLNALPSDISSLYDVVWAGIRRKNRRDGSWMIQVVAAAQGPLSCFSMWLADESRKARVDVRQLPINIKIHAAISLKRRLASRTRGLLEVTEGVEKFVDFSHRTARDWAQQSRVWDDIRSFTDYFDPNIVLFEAETLALSFLHEATGYSPGSLWVAITKALWHASQSDTRKASNKRLVELMDFFDETIQETYERAQTTWLSPDKLESGKQHWSTKQNRSMLRSSFVGLAVQFSIISYLQSKMGIDRKLQDLRPSKDLCLVTYAVFGHEHFTGYDIQSFLALPQIPLERRLATVEFLLEVGATPAKSFWARFNKVKDEQDLGAHERKYYDEIFTIIKERNSLRGHARSMSRRISAVLSSARRRSVSGL